MDIDGSNQKNISKYTGLDWVYRTYKDKIYFISDRDTTCKRCYKLYEMDQDGNNIKKISDLVLEDSWMEVRKNGKEMIVSARIGREIRAQLFLLNLENGSYTQLTNDTSAYHTDPVFLPMENRSLFVTVPTGGKVCQNRDLYYGMMMAPLYDNLHNIPKKIQPHNSGRISCWSTEMEFQRKFYKLYVISKWEIRGLRN